MNSDSKVHLTLRLAIIDSHINGPGAGINIVIYIQVTMGTNAFPTHLPVSVIVL